MIVRLQGGLGNQMFQYAFGRSLSIARKEELFFTRNRVDADSKPMRHYMLDAYGLYLDFKEELEDPIIKEHPFCFNPFILKAPRGACFDGHWQTEKYFDVHLIRYELRSPVGSPSDATLALASKIYRCRNSAFIGVRRGDYVDDVNQKDFHGLMPMDYHREGMRIIREKHPDTQFFILTDDPEWCKPRFPDCTVIEGNSRTPWWDIWLASLCDHAVIANSTFHWWAAYLGADSRDGIVVAPKKWFLVDLESKDICPDRWIKI